MERVRLALVAALMVPLAPALPFVAEHVHALAGDPVVTVTVSPAAPVAGDLVTFHTCVDQAGYVPGGQKITRTNRSTRSTINWANSSVIPRTFVDPCWDFTYQTGASDASTSSYYTFSACVVVSPARLPRQVCGAGYFSVAAPTAP
jgi:hypothetical protein